MFFHGEVLLAPHPTPKLEDHLSSAVIDRIFVLSVSHHNWIYNLIYKFTVPLTQVFYLLTTSST